MTQNQEPPIICIPIVVDPEDPGHNLRAATIQAESCCYLMQKYHPNFGDLIIQYLIEAESKNEMSVDKHGNYVYKG